MTAQEEDCRAVWQQSEMINLTTEIRLLHSFPVRPKKNELQKFCSSWINLINLASPRGFEPLLSP